MSRASSRKLRLGLLLLFVGLPLLELYVLIQVGEVIGAWWTIGGLVLAAIVGSWLIRREGVRAWRTLTEAIRAGRLPGRELTDAALVLLGGTLMLAPGFITDAFGLAFALPLTRPVFRRMLTGVVTRRLVVLEEPGGVMGFGGPRREPPGPGRGSDGVVRGEVIDDPDEE